jgi:hypothetical protein
LSIRMVIRTASTAASGIVTMAGAKNVNSLAATRAEVLVPRDRDRRSGWNFSGTQARQPVPL